MDDSDMEPIDVEAFVTSPIVCAVVSFSVAFHTLGIEWETLWMFLTVLLILVNLGSVMSLTVITQDAVISNKILIWFVLLVPAHILIFLYHVKVLIPFTPIGFYVFTAVLVLLLNKHTQLPSYLL